MLIHVPQIPADHTGAVPQWNNEIRGISVYHRRYHLVSIKPLYQSSQEIQADLRSYQPTPRAALPPSALFRPIRPESGSHGKSFSDFTLIYDASLAACCAFFHRPTQPNPRIPSSALPFNFSSLFRCNIPRNKIPLAGSHRFELPSPCFCCWYSFTASLKIQNSMFEKVLTLSSAESIRNIMFTVQECNQTDGKSHT